MGEYIAFQINDLIVAVLLLIMGLSVLILLLGTKYTVVLMIYFLLYLSRLQKLEQEVIGGEQARNKELQQRHWQRKKFADQRKAQLINALSEDSEESDSVLLNVYNSIQEEVHAKSQILSRVQRKVGGNSFRGRTKNICEI